MSQLAFCAPFKAESWDAVVSRVSIVSGPVRTRLCGLTTRQRERQRIVSHSRPVRRARLTVLTPLTLSSLVYGLSTVVHTNCSGAGDIHSSRSARRRNSSGTERATRDADP